MNTQNYPLMPQISRFFGIIISMFYDDHNPPHFHVQYNEDKAIVSIKELVVLQGKLSPRVLGLVVEWALQHQEELAENWVLMQEGKIFNKIAPLQ